MIVIAFRALRNAPKPFDRHCFKLEINLPPSEPPASALGVQMATQKDSMLDFRKILRLRFDSKLGHRQIALSTGMSKGAVQKYSCLFKATGDEPPSYIRRQLHVSL
jgi:hypothetical protein